MKFIKKIFNKKSSNVPIAFPITFNGKGVYAKDFNSFNAGVVFEDDGKTGYFYATDKDHKVIYDSLLLYDYSKNKINLPKGDVFIVINESFQKAGIYYNDMFHAVFDFNLKKGANLLNSSVLDSSEWSKDHKWDDENTIEGLKP